MTRSRFGPHRRAWEAVISQSSMSCHFVGQQLHGDTAISTAYTAMIGLILCAIVFKSPAVVAVSRAGIGRSHPVIEQGPLTVDRWLPVDVELAQQLVAGKQTSVNGAIQSLAFVHAHA